MADKEKQDSSVEYEKLIQEIYQALVDQSELTNVKVEHNQSIEGRSGAKHQIDVMWEFEIAGVRYKTFIECKNWSNKVEIGNVRNFFGALHDIGNVNGIVVTKTGFQSGAEQFANHYEIKLLEVRKPNEDDWKGKVKKIVININILNEDISNLKFLLDEDHAKKVMKEKGVKEFKHTAREAYENEVFLFDKEGKKLISIYDWKDRVRTGVGPDRKEIAKERRFYEFKDEEVYMETDMGLIRLRGIGYDYELRIPTEQIVIDGEQIVRAIIKDIKDGSVKLFDIDGKVRESS